MNTLRLTNTQHTQQALYCNGSPKLDTKMKQLIHKLTFNDKNFWQMFTPSEAIDYFMPDRAQWESQGVEFTIEDHNQHDRYIRDIELWAEGADNIILMLVLKHGNK